MPNAWRLLLGLQVLSEQHNIPISWETFAYCYYAKEHDSKKGRVKFVLRSRKRELVTKLERNERNWKNMYFFIGIEYAFGSRGSGDVPVFWQIAGFSSEPPIVWSQVPESILGVFILPCRTDRDRGGLHSCLPRGHEDDSIPSWKEVYGQEINKKRKADSSKSGAADVAVVGNGLGDDGSSGGDGVTRGFTRGASSSMASDVSDGIVKLTLSADASLYNDSHAFGGEVDKLLLPKDSDIFAVLSTKDVASYCISEGLRGVLAAVYLRKVISDLEKKNRSLQLVNQKLREENNNLRASDITSRVG